MTEQNLRWTRQPYSTIYASKGAKYFEDQFNNITTIGRGGGDYSAAIYGAYLNVKYVNV